MPCSRGCCASFAEHVRSVHIGAGALGNRKPHTASAIEADKRFSKDNEAYRRLRAEGIQPRKVDGAAAVEQIAEHRFQIESGRMLGQKVSDSRIKEGMELSRELGIVTEPGVKTVADA